MSPKSEAVELAWVKLDTSKLHSSSNARRNARTSIILCFNLLL